MDMNLNNNASKYTNVYNRDKNVDFKTVDTLGVCVLIVEPSIILLFGIVILFLG